jgi:hypothetical protein
VKEIIHGAGAHGSHLSQLPSEMADALAKAWPTWRRPFSHERQAAESSADHGIHCHSVGKKLKDNGDLDQLSVENGDL